MVYLYCYDNNNNLISIIIIIGALPVMPARSMKLFILLIMVLASDRIES